MGKSIRLGGPGVYNAGDVPRTLSVAGVGGTPAKSAVFDIEHGPSENGYKNICSNISEGQAGEVIAALLEVFPGLGTLVAPPAPPEPYDVITAWFDGEGDAPVILELRVRGNDVLAINAGDYEGFAIRVKDEDGTGYSKSLGTISPVIGDNGERLWRAKPPFPKQQLDNLPSAISAIAYLLGLAGYDA